MRKLIVLAMALACYGQPAWAGCTQHGTAVSTSSIALPANDLGNGRDMLFVQNTGTLNPMNVSIGQAGGATSSDILLDPKSSLILQTFGKRAVPNGEVDVISAVGTSFAICDF